jgi:hypothetical protein
VLQPARAAAKLLGGLDGDETARGYILEQDREIAEKIRLRHAGDQEPRAGRREEVGCSSLFKSPPRLTLLLASFLLD